LAQIYLSFFLLTLNNNKMPRTRKIKAKRRADGKLDKRTKKGKEIAARLEKARATRKKNARKKRFFFW
jgi:hypothetical protein